MTTALIIALVIAVALFLWQTWNAYRYRKVAQKFHDVGFELFIELRQYRQMVGDLTGGTVIGIQDIDLDEVSDGEVAMQVLDAIKELRKQQRHDND